MSQGDVDGQGRLFEEPASSVSEGGSPAGARRLRRPERQQVALRYESLDQLLPRDHEVRAVWAYVEGLDEALLWQGVRSVAGGPGHPAADPRVLLALWLYATVQGVNSARAVDRLCREHLAYQWLCGGVSLNYHTLADYRVEQVAVLDELLTISVAVLLHQGLVTLERVAQDGVRVRASAGTSSFRREATLEEALAEAEEQWAALQAEEPSAGTRRRQAAQQRAARERCERVTAALAELPSVAARKKPAKAKAGETAEETAKRSAPRASTTDPEARVMKKGDGGFGPAFNVNFAADCGSQVVVGVAVTNVGSDHGLLVPMAEQVEARYGQRPGSLLADTGYDKHADLEDLERTGTTVYLPPQRQRGRGSGPYEAQPGESAVIAAWRARMGTAEGQAIYRDRAATAECVNAQARNRGLTQFRVRGLVKVRAVVLLQALTHNLRRAVALGAKF